MLNQLRRPHWLLEERTWSFSNKEYSVASMNIEIEIASQLNEFCAKKKVNANFRINLR